MNRHLSTTLQALAVLVPFGLLAWLNGRADVNSIRWGLAAIIVLFATGFLIKNFKRLWSPLFIGLLAGIALGLVFLTSPDVSSQWFEEFVGKAAAWYFVACLAWLYVRLALPKAKAKFQATGILILGLVLSIAQLIISLIWWLTAVDLYAMDKNPVVTTGPELKAQWDAGYGARYRGIFAVGTLGDASKRSEPATGQSNFLAYYSSRKSGSLSITEPQNLFPIHYDLTLADGTKVGVQGIQSVRQASNWPEGGPHLWQRCLQEGDHVVIWADPGETKNMATGEAGRSLNFPRVIAYGSFNDFKNGYLARSTKTARVFGWIGFALIPFSLIPGILALIRWKWLRQHGSDEAPSSGTHWS